MLNLIGNYEENGVFSILCKHKLLGVVSDEWMADGSSEDNVCYDTTFTSLLVIHRTNIVAVQISVA